MKNPFAKECPPPLIHSNSRAGGIQEAEIAKQMFGSNLRVSGFNKRVRAMVRTILAGRKPQTPRMDCRQARRNP